MNTRNTLLAALLAAALPVAAQTSTAPATSQPNPAKVQVVDKATADAQAKSAKQGAKAAKAKKKKTKKTVHKDVKAATPKAG